MFEIVSRYSCARGENMIASFAVTQVAPNHDATAFGLDISWQHALRRLIATQQICFETASLKQHAF